MGTRLDRKRETISTTTNNSNKRAKSEEEKRVPPPIQTQRQTTPPGNLESGNHQSVITTNQAAKGEVCTTKRLVLDDANRNVSSPTNDETEGSRTQPHSPQTYTAPHTLKTNAQRDETASTDTTTPYQTTSTAAIDSLMERVKKLSDTKKHEAKQTSDESSIIITDTIEEFEYAYTRMRAIEIRAGRRPFVNDSAEKFDLDQLKHLTEKEKNMINKEMKDEVRIRSWIHEAKSQLALHGRYQSIPYHQTHKEMFEPFICPRRTNTS
jgi:hypothetical protein